MRKLYPIALILMVLGMQSIQAQTILPRWMTPEEYHLIKPYQESRASSSRGITTPPNFPVRTMAEWEEADYLYITWTSFPSILSQIVDAAKTEVTVVIVCTDSNSVKSSLNQNGVSSTGVKFLVRNFDTIWIRDYGANTVYRDEVDSLMLVDWIYNRPRPNDDGVPAAISTQLNLPLYEMTTSPYDLVHTGGNFMADGFGTAFSSELVDEENDANGQFNQTIKTPAQVDSLMKNWMGIDRYIKMTVLPYDGIHHIDMHMKLLDEETLLIGEYPTGQADGPQIEANIQYVLNNYQSMWGTPYKIIRIPMPPDDQGLYPDQGPWWAPGDYRTYANALFVNKKVLLPVYEEEFDTTAIRIWEESMPGYEIIGINCSDIIPLGGAIHCITRLVGSTDPLLIAHQQLVNTTNTATPYTVDATIKHKSGIASANLYYTTDTTQPWNSVSMALTNAASDTWSADIPAQNNGTDVYYYVEANSNSGKSQVRPMPAPQGWWKFYVGIIAGREDLASKGFLLENAFPNPASAITCAPVSAEMPIQGKLSLIDIFGREIEVLHEGTFPAGISRYFFEANRYSSGTYLLRLETERGNSTQKIMIK